MSSASFYAEIGSGHRSGSCMNRSQIMPFEKGLKPDKSLKYGSVYI